LKEIDKRFGIWNVRALYRPYTENSSKGIGKV